MKENNLHKNNFKVPENYFDNFTNEIMSKVQTEEPRKRFQLNAMKYAAVAASVLIVLSLTFGLVKFNNNNKDQFSKNFDTNNIVNTNNNNIIVDNHYTDEYDELLDWSATMGLTDEELYILLSIY